MTPDYLAEQALLLVSRMQREAEALPFDLEADYSEEPLPED